MKVELRPKPLPAPQPLPCLWFEIFADDKRVGSLELMTTADTTPRLGGHMAYTVFAPYRGRGIATQAVRRALEIAQKVEMPRVDIALRPENAACRRVCQKLGGEYAGRTELPEGHPLRIGENTALEGYFWVFGSQGLARNADVGADSVRPL